MSRPVTSMLPTLHLAVSTTPKSPETEMMPPSVATSTEGSTSRTVTSSKMGSATGTAASMSMGTGCVSSSMASASAVNDIVFPMRPNSFPTPMRISVDPSVRLGIAHSPTPADTYRADTGAMLPTAHARSRELVSVTADTSTSSPPAVLVLEGTTSSTVSSARNSYISSAAEEVCSPSVSRMPASPCDSDAGASHRISAVDTRCATPGIPPNAHPVPSDICVPEICTAEPPPMYPDLGWRASASAGLRNSKMTFSSPSTF